MEKNTALSIKDTRENRFNIYRSIFKRYEETANNWLRTQLDWFNGYDKLTAKLTKRLDNIEAIALRDARESFFRDEEINSTEKYFVCRASVGLFNNYIALVEEHIEELQDEIAQAKQEK